MASISCVPRAAKLLQACGRLPTTAAATTRNLHKARASLNLGTPRPLWERPASRRHYTGSSPRAQAAHLDFKPPHHGARPSSQFLDSLDVQQPEKWDVHADGGSVQITHKELLVPLSLDAALMRDACPCPACVNPSSGQKSHSTADVSPDVVAVEAVKTEDGALKVVWAEDGLGRAGSTHTSTYPSELVESLMTKEKGREFPLHSSKVLWDKSIGEDPGLFTEYADWMAGGDKYVENMRRLVSHGLLIIRNVPHSETSVIDVAGQIGHLYECFYGRTWDVVSKPQAENVAYTNSYLGLHQDLLYMRPPPKIQLLHCLENEASGGESLFSDSERTSRMLRHINWKQHDELRKHGFKYHYDKGEHQYEFNRPVIDENHRVWWSPPFQAPFQKDLAKLDTEEFRKFHKATRALKELLEMDGFVFQYKLRPGECVIFDNIRVLHGRNEFDVGSGHRWLKGTYVDNKTFHNKIMSLPPPATPIEAKGYKEQIYELIGKHGLEMSGTSPHS